MMSEPADYMDVNGQSIDGFWDDYEK